MKYTQIEKIKKQKYPGSAPTVGKMESQQVHHLYVADGKLLFVLRVVESTCVMLETEDSWGRTDTTPALTELRLMGNRNK